jgi:hypothetical protein
LIIADHRKAYSEDDFAIILAKAAELSPESSSQDSEPGSLSLAEMKSIAREVGLDPELIERAAHILPGVTRPTLMGRLFGGPLSSHVELLIPVQLTQEGAQRLLSLVRATLLTHGQGEATSTGMSFSSFEGWQKVFISAHLDGASTRIRVVVDNRSRLLVPIVLAPLGTLLVVALAVGVGPAGPGDPSTALPWYILGGGTTTIAGLLWRSVRKTVHRTLRTLDDLVDVLSSYARRKDAT